MKIKTVVYLGEEEIKKSDLCKIQIKNVTIDRTINEIISQLNIDNKK